MKKQVCQIVTNEAMGPAVRSAMPASRPGFSLIEVLISIFVLALGLLGVAAVFPAVVRQQRTVSDSIQGVSIERSVEELLRGDSRFTAKTTFTPNASPTLPPIPSPKGWSLIAGDAKFSPNGAWTTTSASGTSPLGINPVSGEMTIGYNDIGGVAVTPITIPVADRLIPRPESGGLVVVQPRYVWDFIARRVPAGETPYPRTYPPANTPANFSKFDDDVLQLAVFVRRIDSGIRPHGGLTLSDILTGSNGSSDRVPVAVDADGTPTFDGKGADMPNYSPIKSMSVDLASRVYTAVETVVNPARIALDQSTTFAKMRPFVEQIGQKFVDKFGVIHEVVGIDRTTTPSISTVVKIEPAMALNLFFAPDGTTPAPAQLFYTPQVPASVSILTVRR